MRSKFLYIILFIYQFSLSQNCKCKSNPILNEIITCKKTIFKNGAKIYRQFNCDSSWVVFESKYKKKKILDALQGELIELM